MLLMTDTTQSFTTYETLIAPSKLLCWVPVQGKLTTTALKGVRPLGSVEVASRYEGANRLIISAGLDADGRMLYFARASQRNMAFATSLEDEDNPEYDGLVPNSPPSREQEKPDQAFGVVRVGDFRQYKYRLVPDPESLMISFVLISTL